MTETIAERFARDTARHVLTVLHDDGLYRHLRFRRPADETSAYWFDLITWPGCLTINGDCGTFTFSRVEDMLSFFRGPAINPQYWAEKIRAREISGETTRYSQDKFRQMVAEYATEAEADWPGLTAAIDEQFYGPYSEWNTEDEHEARRALDEFKFEDFRFEDTWEWDLRDFDWQFLWCCHAIQWGVRQFDQARVKADA